MELLNYEGSILKLLSKYTNSYLSGLVCAFSAFMYGRIMIITLNCVDSSWGRYCFDFINKDDYEQQKLRSINT